MILIAGAFTLQSAQSPPNLELFHITGKVTYDDKVTDLRPVDMSADPDCEAKNNGSVPTPVLTMGENNALANVIIEVKDVPKSLLDLDLPPRIMKFEACMCNPHVIAIRKGHSVRFMNKDGILHNVHGLPKVNREFNIGMPPGVTEKDMEFNEAEGPFKIKCDVHPWESTYLAVYDHPNFAVTDKTGEFDINGIPDGTYEVTAWHEKLGTRTGSITIDGGDASLNFSFMIPRK